MMLSFAKLQKHLSPQEHQQIEDMPTPTIEQAKQVLSMFDFSRDKPVEWVMGNLPMLKVYIKCARTYPELLI